MAFYNYLATGIALCVLLGGCANKILNYEHVDQIKVSNEFEKTVKIEEVKPTETKPSEQVAAPTPQDTKASTVLKIKESPNKAKAKKSKTGKVKQQALPAAPVRRQPEVESDIGFSGRRPLMEPFRIGEKVAHKVKYLGVEAGELSFEVLPFVMVNGRKSYTFKVSIKTSPLFSKFYSVDDYAETLVDYETLLPSVFSLHVRETSQIRESKSFFDQEKHHAVFWENKVTDKGGKEEKRQEWETSPYAQNVFSSLFYLRVFQWPLGAANAFVVSHDEKNLVFKGKTLRKEHLSTEAGEFDTIVMQPEFTLQGKFEPVGDIFFWITDDSRKLLVRVEAKIKIGSLVSEVFQVNKGEDEKENKQEQK